MNDFGDTPQQQPEGFCIITNQLHTNDFSVAAEKDDNDDDDSIFEFAPVQTAYEKSQSAATAAATAASSSQEFNMYNHPSNTNNPRKVRAFGLSASRRTHGTTGSSSSSNFRFPRSIPSTPTTARNATLFGGFGAGGGTVVARETGALNDPDWALDPTDAGGALADESSPEFVRPPPRMSHTHNHHSQSCSSFMNHPEFQTRSSDNHKNVETEIVEEEPLDDCRRRPLFQRNRNPTTMTTTNHSSRSSSARSSPINTGGGGCFHSRGGSSMALLTKSTSTALFPRPSNTRNGSRRVFQRSHSLALGSNHRTFQNNNHAMNAASVPNLNYTDSSCPQQMWMLGQDDDEWEENCHPNSNNRYMNAKTHTNHTIYPLDDDAVERSFFPTGDGGGGEAPNHHHPYSKKSRSSRRHSIATASRSAIFGDCDRTMSCTSSSSLSSSATSLQLLPPDLQWLGSSSNSTTTTSAAAPEMGGMEQHFSSSSESALATTGGLSSKKGRSLSILQSPIIEGGRTSSHGNNSEDRSAASSSNRKRGVCGSPISDYGGDDFFQDRLTLSSSSLSVDARRRRARSRVFLPEPDVCWPPLPCLAAPRRGDAAAAMELEDNSDDEEGGKELSMNQSSSSTPESSFEAAGTAAVVRRREPSLIPPDDEESKIRSIIDHLPCLDDLEFLIGELRRERDRRQKNIDRGGSSFVFGSKEAWKFVTQGPLWTGHRRAAFMTWARTHLGFAIRSAGMGYTYIQISHSKGAPLLDMLEATKSVYENEQRVNNGTKVEDEPSATLSLFPCPSTQHPALPLGVIDSNAVCPLPIL